MRMTRLAIRPGTCDNVLEPLVAIILLSGRTAPVRAIRFLVMVFVHHPTAHGPTALAHEPTCLPWTDKQVRERAPARGLDMHHVLNARTRLARQEAEYRLAGR